MSQSPLQAALGQLQCPVQLRSRVRLPFCSLQVSLASGCPFGHTITDVQAFLRPIPSYICVGHLLNRCPFVAEHENANDRTDSFVYCALGLHPTCRDLTEPEYFTERLVGTILAQTQQASSQPPAPRYPSLDDDLCGICLQWITASNRSYGNQELCSHPFCVQCICEWYESRPNQESRRCPTCRVRSDRILVWPRLVRSQLEKFTLLQEQARAVNLSGNAAAGGGGRAIVSEHAPLFINRANRVRRVVPAMVMQPNVRVQAQPHDPIILGSTSSDEDN